MSKRKDGQYGVYKVGRTECAHCNFVGHVDELAFCLTCGSYVCPNHMALHEKSISHVVSWSLSKRYNWKATTEHLNRKIDEEIKRKTESETGDKYDKLDSEAPNAYNPASGLFPE